MHNYSLILLKPDFTELNLHQELIELLESQGIALLTHSNVKMDIDFLKEFYQWGKIFYPEMIEKYLCKEKMPVWIVAGDNAIIKVLEIKRRLRVKYYLDKLRTLMHSSDSEKDFFREYNLINKRVGINMRTNNQVEVIVFQRTGNDILYLMLKRNEKKRWLLATDYRRSRGW